MLVAFQSSDLAEPKSTIIGIEGELQGELVPGVPDPLARVDLLVDAGDCLVMTDLKTARSRWSAEQVRESYAPLVAHKTSYAPG